MKDNFDKISFAGSKIITNTYSTSFSLGIKFLSRQFHNPIYGIYGFVRLADEIVDSFHEFDKRGLLNEFRAATFQSISSGISLNPVLNSFQFIVRKYSIEKELIDLFFESMEMDLNKKMYNKMDYDKYILGSAEVVGLMCLKVFCKGNHSLYNSLKGYAMKLGSAFQKINFLRDLKSDQNELGRIYFPDVNFTSFHDSNKQAIQADIENDLRKGLEGIRKLPASSRAGVYLAYYYYLALFNKIKSLPAQKILSERIRVSNTRKIGLMINSLIRTKLNLI